MRYSELIRGMGDAASDVFAAVRRRRERSSPRVRVRTGHAEARVLSDDSPTRERLLSLAEELVSAYAKSGGRGRSGF